MTVTLSAAPAVVGFGKPETASCVVGRDVHAMPLWVPVIVPLTVSVAVMDWVPAVLSVTLGEGVRPGVAGR